MLPLVTPVLLYWPWICYGKWEWNWNKALKMHSCNWNADHNSQHIWRRHCKKQAPVFCLYYSFTVYCIAHLQSLPLIKHRLDHKKKIMCEWNIMCFIPFSEDSNEKVQGLLCYIHIGILYRWTTLIGSEADIMEFEIYEGEARTVSPISVAPWVKAPQYSVYS